MDALEVGTADRARAPVARRRTAKARIADDSSPHDNWRRVEPCTLGCPRATPTEAGQGSRSPNRQGHVGSDADRRRAGSVTASSRGPAPPCPSRSKRRGHSEHSASANGPHTYEPHFTGSMHELEAPVAPLTTGRCPGHAAAGRPEPSTSTPIVPTCGMSTRPWLAAASVRAGFKSLSPARHRTCVEREPPNALRARNTFGGCLHRIPNSMSRLERQS